jgi:methyl-accepting chemotaxis protein/methyl-accepting chemotaxis protein-1 (serine sensor receptor)
MAQMTLQKKLLGSCSALAAVGLIGAFSAAWITNRLGTEMDQAINGAAHKLAAVSQFSTLVYKIRVAGRNTLVYAYFQKPETMEEEIRKGEAATAQIGAAEAEVKRLMTSPEEKAAWAQVEGTLEAWSANTRTVNQLCRTGTPAEATASSAKNGRAVSQTLDKANTDLFALEQRELQAASERSVVIRSWSRWTTILGIIVIVVVAAIVLVLIRNVNHQLREVIRDLKQGAVQVAGAATQVSGSSKALAEGASQQAASLEETSASSTEITSMTEKNADNARAAASLMTETSTVVRDANSSLDQMQTSMREINASSSKIGKIIQVIDEIAFQTNILALNAAVEAARAGEAGMGFAVVADEVRNLAQRSAQAARDTATLIEESIAKSNEGGGKLDQVSSAIRNLTEGAQKVKVLVDEVKAGSEEQARGIAQIGKALAEMDSVTQRTAASAEETASAGEEMTAGAKSLNGIVEQLQAMVGVSE